jgi:hypothetical protein
LAIEREAAYASRQYSDQPNIPIDNVAGSLDLVPKTGFERNTAGTKPR